MQVKALCDGVVETLGRVRYDGKVKHPFTAHPKVDPETGRVCCGSICLGFTSELGTCIVNVLGIQLSSFCLKQLCIVIT